MNVCNLCNGKYLSLMMDFGNHERLKLAPFLSGTLEKGIQIEENDFHNVRENQLFIYQNVLLLMFWKNSI